MGRLSFKAKEAMIQRHMKLFHCNRETAEQMLQDDLLIDDDKDEEVSYRHLWTDEKWNFTQKNIFKDINKAKELRRKQNEDKFRK